MKKGFLYNLIRRGLELQPGGGVGRVFYPKMFIASHKLWEATILQQKEDCFHIQEEVFEETGNGTSIGGYWTEEVGDFVYLFELDAWARQQAVAFTHRVIARDKKGEAIYR